MASSSRYSQVSLGCSTIPQLRLDGIVFEADERKWFRSIIRREASRTFAMIGFGEIR
jgi:hypothetical protein